MWNGAGNGAEAIDCALRFTRQSDYQERPTMAANERDKMAFGVSSRRALPRRRRPTRIHFGYGSFVPFTIISKRST
jgi:hypothetical protein